MLSPRRPVTVLLLLCFGTADVSGAHSTQFRLKTSYFSNYPNKTVSAVSAVQCGAECTATTEPPFCDGFEHYADGTCYIYSDLDVCEISDLAEEDDYGTTGSFRRRGTAACPGIETDACGCPGEFQRCGGRCYAFPEQTVNFTQAEKVCNDLGGHLATTRTPAERQCVPTLTAGAECFLGGYGLYDEDYDFNWVDGCGVVPLAPELWHPGQPSDTTDGVEDYCLVSSQGLWDDLPCHAQRRPFCQLANCYQAHCQ